MTCKLTYMSASMLASKYSLQVSFHSFQSSLDGTYIRRKTFLYSKHIDYYSSMKLVYSWAAFLVILLESITCNLSSSKKLFSGNTTLNFIYKFPLLNGLRYCGIPSPTTPRTHPNGKKEKHMFIYDIHSNSHSFYVPKVLSQSCGLNLLNTTTMVLLMTKFKQR